VHGISLFRVTDSSRVGLSANYGRSHVFLKIHATLQAGENHGNDAHDLNAKALSNRCNQKHGSQEAFLAEINV
jgi:hypothetical protein